MKRASFPVLLGGLSLSLLGCDVVLGLGDYKEGPPSAGGSGGGASASTAASMSTATGTTGSMTTGSTMTSCSPGMDYDCYTGPDGTLDVGVCRSGTHTCKTDGETFSECVNQVLPSGETCRDDKLDEDCDEAECVLGAQRLGDDKDQGIGAIAHDGSGNLWIAGRFGGTLTLDPTHVLTNAKATPSTYLAKIGPAGDVLFAKAFDITLSVTSLSVDAMGGVVLAGTHSGTVNFGGPDLACVSYGCSSVAKFTAAGVYDWSLKLELDDYTNVMATAIGANNAIYLWGDQNCGDGCSSSNFFLRKLTQGGITSWTKTYTTASGYSSREAGGIAFAPTTGNVFIVGSYKGSESLGQALGTTADAWDVVLGEIDASGNTVRKKTIGGALDQKGKAVAVDAVGNAYVLGSFAGSTQVGNETLNANAVDIFLARINPTGQYDWAKSYGGASDQQGLALGVQPGATPSVVFTGVAEGNVDFGGGLITGGGGLDAYFVKVNGADGGYTWSRMFGDAADQSGKAILVNGMGESVVALNVAGSIDLGGGVLAPGGMTDFVLARLGR